jgi:hypothetical protein
VIGGQVQTINREIGKSKMWFMDLTEDEERMLRETGCFSFESVPSFLVGKISQVELDAGMKRKEEILYVL